MPGIDKLQAFKPISGFPYHNPLGDLLPHFRAYFYLLLILLFENRLVLPEEGDAEEQHDAKNISHKIKELQLEPVGSLRDDARLRIMVGVRVVVKLPVGYLVHVKIVQVCNQIGVHEGDPLHDGC